MGEGVSVSGNVCGIGGDRVLTLVWEGQVWGWACLGVVAHFRYFPAGSLGVGGGYAGGNPG